MFDSDKPSGSNFWKFLALGGLLFAIIIGLVLFSLDRSSQELPDLDGVLHRGHPDYDWYRPYLTIEDPRVQMTRNFAGSQLVLFSGSLKNQGERVLDAVELELSFFNHDELVSTTTRFVIRPEPTVRTPPLRILEERGFALYLEDFPEGWLAMHAELAIHGFRFLARPVPE